jgi:hypothetical protein
MARAVAEKFSFRVAARLKAGVDFAIRSARLKPRPFKAQSKSDLFRSL